MSEWRAGLSVHCSPGIMPIFMAAWAAATVPTVKVASLVSFSVATSAVMIFWVLAGGRASCSLNASRTLPVSASTRIQALAGHGGAGGGAVVWAAAGRAANAPDRVRVMRHSNAHTGAGEGRRGMGIQATRRRLTVGGPGWEPQPVARLA